MHPKNPKKLWILFACSVICFVLLLGLSIFFAGVGAYHGAFEQDHAAFGVIEDSTGEEILSEQSSHSLPKGEQVLRLKNDEKESVTFILYQNGIEKGSYTVAAKSEQGIKFDSDGSKLSVIVNQNQKNVAYLSDLAGFLSCSKNMKNGGDLVFLSPVDVSGVTLSASFGSA